jgi:hypothetical protein
MNRILLSLAFLLFIFTANAQFQKGNILLGGDLSYSTNTYSAPNTTDQTSNGGLFNISLGKAIKENTVVGVNLLFSTNTNSYQGDKTVSNGYGIGVFYRVYKNLGKDFYFFAQGGAEYNGSTNYTKDATGTKTDNSSTNGGSIYLTPGISYKISKKIFIELSIPQIFTIGYSSNSTNLSPGVSSKEDGFSAGINLNSNTLTSLGLGFRLVL